MAKVNLKTKNISLGIYSGSGNSSVSIMKSVSSIPNIVNFMLMDPYPSPTLVTHAKRLVAAGTKTYLTYRPGNWGTTGGYDAGIKELSKSIPGSINTGGSNNDHANQPGYLLKKFKSNIETVLVSPTGVSISTPTITPTPVATPIVTPTPVTPAPTTVVEEEIATPAPTDRSTEQEDFLFLSETGVEISPTQIYSSNTLPSENDEQPDINDYKNVEDSKNKDIEGKINTEISKKKTITTTKGIKDKKQNHFKDGQNVLVYGSVDNLIQNNTEEFGNLGDVVYYPTALFNQGDKRWGDFDGGKMRSAGCCFNACTMFASWATKDPKITPLYYYKNYQPTYFTNQDNFMAHVKVKIHTIGIAGCTPTKYLPTLADIDKALRTSPVIFEWQQNACKRGVNTKYSGLYSSGNQHWMVIVGKYSDGTYCIFDPANGKIHYNATGEGILAGLNRIEWFDKFTK